MTGVLEGSGSFTFNRTGSQFVLIFGVKGEPAILRALQSYFGVGRLTDGDRAFRVTQREELEHVLEHVDAHPFIGSKHAIYDVWRQMVVAKRDTFRNAPTDVLEELAAKLVALRSTPLRGRARRKDRG